MVLLLLVSKKKGRLVRTHGGLYIMEVLIVHPQPLARFFSQSPLVVSMDPTKLADLREN